MGLSQGMDSYADTQKQFKQAKTDLQPVSGTAGRTGRQIQREVRQVNTNKEQAEVRIHRQVN